jgi:hypothetical protein
MYKESWYVSEKNYNIIVMKIGSRKNKNFVGGKKYLCGFKMSSHILHINYSKKINYFSKVKK